MPRLSRYPSSPKEVSRPMDEVIDEVVEEEEEEPEQEYKRNPIRKQQQVQLVTENQLLNAKIDHIINLLERE